MIFKLGNVLTTQLAASARFTKLVILLPLFTFFLAGCGSSQESNVPAFQNSADKILAEGKAKYNEEKYLDAIKILGQLRLTQPTADVTPEAIFLEGMSHFNLEEYSLAARNFQTIRATYPGSPFAPRAQYMSAESYYKLSPRSELDQKNTDYALAEYQGFLRDFATNTPSLTDSAQNRITELRAKLAKKIFLAAELYRKLEEYKSAKIYYERLLDQYYDSEYAASSAYDVALIAYEEGKTDEARKALDRFDTRFLSIASVEVRQQAQALRAKL